MSRRVLIFLCILATAFQSTLWGMDPLASEVYFHVKVTAHGGLTFSSPGAMHKDFILSEEAFTTIHKSLLSDPFALHHACVNIIKPGFTSLMKTHSLLVSLSQNNSVENFQNYYLAHQQSLSLCKVIHQTCPLAFFQECNGGATGTCPLTRTAEKTSCPREAFINTIEKMLIASESALNPVFYGAGDCFAEIEMMARLKRAGHKLGTIVLIEPGFKVLKETLALLSQEKSFSVETKDINYKVQPLALKSVIQILQLLYFVKHLEQESSVVVYLDHGSYLADVSAGVVAPSRLVVALDYQDHPDALDPNLDKELGEIWSSAALTVGGLMARAHSVSEVGDKLRIVTAFEQK